MCQSISESTDFFPIKTVYKRKMPPRRTYNERRARVHLMKKTCTRACSAHQCPYNFLLPQMLLFNLKIEEVRFFYFFGHMPSQKGTCTWRTWAIKSELLLRYTRCHRKKFEPIRSSVTIVIWLWSCSRVAKVPQIKFWHVPSLNGTCTCPRARGARES